jgi:hypothetical protein
MSANPSQVIIGIDTGQKGAACVLIDGKVARIVELTEEFPLQQLVACLWGYSTPVDFIDIVYEKPSGFMSKKASWWAGYYEAVCLAFGEWAIQHHAFDASARIRIRSVRPQDWQKRLFTTTPRTMKTKKRAAVELRRLMPEVNTTHDGCVDACLIALYGRLTSGGEPSVTLNLD